jgi:hypothetical protein
MLSERKIRALGSDAHGPCFEPTGWRFSALQAGEPRSSHLELLRTLR